MIFRGASKYHIFAVMSLISWIEIVFAIITLTLLGYYLIIWRKLLDFKHPEIKSPHFPFLSVIVCAKNEKENLIKHLPEILNQDYPNFEVLVIDDHSTDGTGAILNQFAAKYENFKPFKFDQEKVSGGKKEVLAYGISESKGEYLVMTDADCWPKSDQWLKRMAAGFEGGHELVLGIGLYKQEKTFLNQFIQLDTGFIALNYLSFALAGFPYMSVGRNVAYKKSLFNKVGGFQSHLNIPSGDDDLFVNELPKGTKVNIVTSPKAQTLSVPKKTSKSFLIQKTRHVSAGMKYNKTNQFLLGVFYSFTMFWYLLLPILICYSEWILLILTSFVLKKLTMYSLINRIFSKIGVSVMWQNMLFADLFSVFVHNFAVLTTIFKRKKGGW